MRVHVVVVVAVCLIVEGCSAASRLEDGPSTSPVSGAGPVAGSTTSLADEVDGEQMDRLGDELVEMAAMDQEERSRFGEPDPGPWNDEERTARLIEIVDEFGWPTPDLVGPDGASAAWLIAQHSDADPGFQQRALALLSAAEPGYPGKDEHVALLTDRVAANTGQPQTYGSQVRCLDGEPVPYPRLADPDQVDERREEASLEPLGTYLTRFEQQCTELAAMADNAGCAPVPGADELIEPGAIILVGEVHGTVESPSFVSDLACIALSYGLEVTVAVEIPSAEAEAIDAFLVSDGDSAARRALLAGPFWSRDNPDGRTSTAMLDLLDELRRHVGDGRPLDVLPIDTIDTGDRDTAMAQRLIDTITANPNRVVIALTGNVHNRTVRGASFDPDYEPMGFLIETTLNDRSVWALDVTYSAGAAWTCLQDQPCAVHPVQGNAPNPETPPDTIPFVHVLPDRNTNGFDGYYYVGELTPAPPALNSNQP